MLVDEFFVDGRLSTSLTAAEEAAAPEAAADREISRPMVVSRALRLLISLAAVPELRIHTCPCQRWSRRHNRLI